MYNPQLETFLRVADAGSFNKAAEEAFITVPAVIKQINLLEEKLGLTLFVRTHKGVTLTEAGKSLYRDTKYIVQYCQDSVARAKQAAQNETQVIRIGTSPITPAQVLLDLWPQIHEQCPDIKFQLVPFENTQENAREILKNLGTRIDLVAGLFDDLLLKQRKCAGLSLLDTPLCCAVPITHPLASREKLTISDLYGESLLMLRRGWSQSMDHLRDDLIVSHPQIQILDFDFYCLDVFNRCENDHALLVSIGTWERVHPLLKLVPVEWDYTIPYGLLYAPAPSAAVQRVLKAIQEILL